MKRIYFVIIVLIIFLETNAQNDSMKIERINAIRFNDIGKELLQLKKYKEAIDYFNKAINVDSTFGEAYYNRAISIVSANPNEFIDFNICKEFKKAINHGKKVSDEDLFFYGCTLKDDIRNKKKRKEKR